MKLVNEFIQKKVGANIKKVSKAIGMDDRIGDRFLIASDYIGVNQDVMDNSLKKFYL